MSDNARGPDSFDWVEFGHKVMDFLEAEDLGRDGRAAARRFGGSASCWFRAQAGQKLSVGNCLFVCRVINRDPYDFTIFRGVASRGVSRKTQTETCMNSGA